MEKNNNLTYRQVVDSKTGEIKFVPTTPPTPPPISGGAPPENSRRMNKVAKNVLDTYLDNVDTNSSDKLKNVLEQLINNSKKLRYNRRLDTGKLDGRSLSQYKLTNRLFKKRAIKYKKYQFNIMLDTSGSMFDDKIELATSSIVQTVQALEELDISVSVWGMNLETALLKGFDETFDYNTFKKRLIDNGAGMTSVDEDDDCDEENNCGGTNEMVAYKEAVTYARNNRASKEQSVLMILSDGAPNAEQDTVNIYHKGEFNRRVPNIYANTDTLRNFLERQTDFNVYGLGIRSDARQVPNNRRIEDVESLPVVMNNLIQGLML